MEAMEQGDEQGYDHNPMLNDCIATYTHINIIHFVQTMHLVHKSHYK